MDIVFVICPQYAYVWTYLWARIIIMHLQLQCPHGHSTHTRCLTTTHAWNFALSWRETKHVCYVFALSRTHICLSVLVPSLRQHQPRLAVRNKEYHRCWILQNENEYSNYRIRMLLQPLHRINYISFVCLPIEKHKIKMYRKWILFFGILSVNCQVMSNL